MNEIIHKAGKFTLTHWDGDVKALLPYARDLGFDAIEAITPVPQGDVTLEEMKDALKDDIFLIDGIAALLFDPLYPLERLAAQAQRLIELFAPKLILGISDEMPYPGDMERLAVIGDMVDAYNASLNSVKRSVTATFQAHIFAAVRQD
jgi:sugar phosphate isomerase/epimerase